jgi:hypothetical protein
MTTQTLQPATLTGDLSAVRTIAISGKSGLVGSALARSLSLAEKKILNVTRDTNARSINDVIWSPNSGIVNPGRLQGTTRRNDGSETVELTVRTSLRRRSPSWSEDLRFWFVPLPLVFTAIVG